MAQGDAGTWGLWKSVVRYLPDGSNSAADRVDHPIGEEPFPVARVDLIRYATYEGDQVFVETLADARASWTIDTTVDLLEKALT